MTIETQHLKFLVGGALAVSLDWSLFFLLATQLNHSFIASKALSFVAGTLFAFAFNGIITFKSHLSFLKFGRHIFVYSCSLLLNIITFDASTKLMPNSFDLRKLTALLAATGISMSTNFIGMRFWVFKPRVLSND